MTPRLLVETGQVVRGGSGEFRCLRLLLCDWLGELWLVEFEAAMFRAQAFLRIYDPRLIAVPGARDALRDRFRAVMEHCECHELGTAPSGLVYGVFTPINAVTLDALVGKVAGSTLLESLRWPALAARIMLDVCRALSPLHTGASPVEHGAVSGASILVGFTGKTQLAGHDAGCLLPFTEQSRAADAPLSASIRPPNPAGDVFALGIVFSQLVMGEPSCLDASEMLAALGRRFGQNQGLLAIIQHAIGPVAERYSTAQPMAADLDAWLATLGDRPSATQVSRMLVDCFHIDPTDAAIFLQCSTREAEYQDGVSRAAGWIHA